MSSRIIEKKQAAKDVIDVLEEISLLLNCHLTRHQLSLCISLIENGVNPEALANVIKDIRTQYPAPSESVGEDEEG